MNELLKAEIAHVRELVAVEVRSRDRATDKAADSIDKRLNAMNQFRDQLKEQASRFITRAEHSALLAQIDAATAVAAARISHLESKVAALDAKFYLGGAGIIILISVFQLIANFWRPLLVH